MSSDERGFTTAQLHTRHWVLTAADGTTDEVNGEGVVGRFPILHEGGWTEVDTNPRTGRRRVGDVSEGTFIYQSMSGGESIAFEGFVRFVPGTLEKPQGSAFDVVVPRFPLKASVDDFIF